MKVPLPCHCDKPNKECRRAGMPMATQALWTLCRTNEAMRRVWDQQAGVRMHEVPGVNGHRRETAGQLRGDRIQLMQFQDCFYMGRVLEQTRAPFTACGNQYAW